MAVIDGGQEASGKYDDQRELYGELLVRTVIDGGLDASGKHDDGKGDGKCELYGELLVFFGLIRKTY